MKKTYVYLEMINGESRSYEFMHEEMLAGFKGSLLKGNTGWASFKDIYVNLDNVLTIRFVEIDETNDQQMTDEELENWL